ncbi:hypothetical protein L6452_23481 [Arctium lappa]|uniref:Uncharacterized protein n=1 Tax=Arctium lappa TaxID=4217 RepID=A0ACB9B171_ARCLA|nr:hypothetical protein L6452_23481 [Arctium lappa]
MTAAAAIQAPRTHSLPVTVRHRRANVMENEIHIRRKSFTFERDVMTTSASASSSSDGRRFLVTALKSPIEEPNSDSNADDPDLPFTSQGDLNFLLKLGAGSFMAAAAIKYGSILVPEITRPNITQALIMISTPVLVSILILIKESRVGQ